MNPTVQGLLEQLGSRDGMERKRAREILVLVGEPAEPEVRPLLDDGSKRVRWEAAKILAAMIDPSSVPALLSLLRSDESELRWIAADGLIALGPRSVVPLLESLLEGPPTKGQTQMSGRVLRELAATNDVLNEIVSPVSDALGQNEPAILHPKVSQALSDLSRITGELPEL